MESLKKTQNGKNENVAGSPIGLIKYIHYLSFERRPVLNKNQKKLTKLLQNNN